MPRRFFALILPVAALTGFALEVVKGNSGDPFRAAVGNMSAPWLVFALVGGFVATSAFRGAVLGLLTTLVALAGFYLGAVVVFGGHLGDQTGSFVHDFMFIATANKVWFLLGLVSGPIFGALGGVLRRPLHLAFVAGALLVLEPIVVMTLRERQLPLIGVWAVDSVPARLLEIGLGLLVLAVASRSRMRST
ncbi:MAG TPA: hypothetical protein VF426_08790 [Marmoricola sp.]